MKPTPAYRTSKAFLQLLALLGILINIAAIIISIYNYKMWIVETDLMSKYTITQYDFSFVCLAINLVLLTFSNCGITSARKSYMAIYSKIAFFYSFILTLIITYIYTIYRIEFQKAVGAASKANGPMGGKIQAMLGSKNANECTQIATGTMDYIIKACALAHLCSVIIYFIGIYTMGYVMNIKLNEDPIPVPSIHDITSAGFNAQSLKKRRIVELVPK